MFAILISRLLDPLWIIPAVTILIAYKQGFFFTFVLLIIILGIPLILRIFYRRHDWDISKRTDRPKALGALLILGLITIVFAGVFGNRAIIQLVIFYEIWLAGFLLISLFWKISGHMGAITLATFLLVSRYGAFWWPVLFLIPLVGWARVITKNHTVFQVISGFAYSFFLLFIYEAWQGVL